jgi:hypothetical protein|tara:strand:- start:566 stop:901 length:336 start_codon:yes stop_codon:yes gene_type:complete
MKATVKDILEILTQVEKIKTTQLLNADQRQTLLTELVQDIPLEVFCHTSKGSRAAISEIIERELHGNSPTQAKKKSTTKAKSVSPAGTQEALFLDSNGDTRGPRVKKAVVK